MTPAGTGAWREVAETVEQAANRRIAQLLDTVTDGQIYVSFSGGKDSTVLLDLVYRQTRARGWTLDVLFIDWEAQYQATIDHVARTLAQPGLRPWWLCLPLTDCNENSMYDLTWTAWDPAARDRWVRALPDMPGVISDPAQLPCYRAGMTFEALAPAWNRWFARERGVGISLIGIRADESINRYRAIKSQRRHMLRSWHWTTQISTRAFMAYPIYDWHVEDIWTYLARTGTPYNPIYDLMWQDGTSLTNMRICEPYTREARFGLAQHARLEPATWARMLDRVPGVAFGASHHGDELLAGRLVRPATCATWAIYGDLLLRTIPEDARAHYEGRARAYLAQHGESEAAWRTVCWTVLRHDSLMTKLKGVCHDPSTDATKKQSIRERYHDL